MLEIGTKFYYEYGDSDDDDYQEGEVTVCGYTYYETALYYVCLYDNGTEVDIHRRSAQDALEEQ